MLLRRHGQGIAFGQDVGVGVERGHVVFGQLVSDVFVVLGVGCVHGLDGLERGCFSGNLFGEDLRFDDFGLHSGMVLFSRHCGRGRRRDRVGGGLPGRLAALGGLGGNATAHMICTSFCHKSLSELRAVVRAPAPGGTLRADAPHGVTKKIMWRRARTGRLLNQML